jgi:hypothetical protein
MITTRSGFARVLVSAVLEDGVSVIPIKAAVVAARAAVHGRSLRLMEGFIAGH